MNIKPTGIASRRGFNILELLVVLAIIGVLIGMLLPAMQRGRVGSYRTQCLNNLRQIALATLNYEAANMRFPACTGPVEFGCIGSANRLGGFVAILPFIEQNNLYEQITKPSVIDGVEYPAFPPLHESGYEPWKERIPFLVCPSLSVDGQKFAKTHYGLCIGDRARNVATPNSLRGGFAGSLQSSFGSITDGSSNTICASEIGSNREGESASPFAIDQPNSMLENPSECRTLVEGERSDWTYRKGVALSSIGRGGHWADGRAGVALFNTILPPKSPNAAVKGSVGVDGIYSATGPHPGTVNIALFDGSVHAISIDVDAGDPSSPTLTEDEMIAGASSPYGAWGALGSANDGTAVSVNDF